MRAFEAQIGIARRTGLPLVIHVRDSSGPGPGAPSPIATSCWRRGAWRRGDPALLLRHGRAGRGGGGAGLARLVRRQRDLPEVGGAAGRGEPDPDRLLLVETDSPFLAPQAVRGKSNGPANVTHTAEVVAEARGIGYEQLDAIVSENAARLFGWSG